MCGMWCWRPGEALVSDRLAGAGGRVLSKGDRLVQLQELVDESGAGLEVGPGVERSGVGAEGAADVDADLKVFVEEAGDELFGMVFCQVAEAGFDDGPVLG